MHLILTGATGLVGSSALAHIMSLPSGQITRLSILSRKPVPVAEGHPNIKVIQHSDFNSYPPSVLEELKGANGVIWALGISQNEVNAEDYVKITKDYTLSAAKAFSTISDKFNFVYVSGEGATTKPGRLTPIFGRVKGETEAALLEMGKSTPSLNIFNVRPAFVDAAYHEEVRKTAAARPASLSKKVTVNIFGPIIRTCLPSMTSPTQDLGRILTDLAAGDGKPLEGAGIEGEGRTVRNVGFRRLAGI